MKISVFGPAIAAGLLVQSMPLAAEEFRPVDAETTFVEVVKGKTLSRFGISLAVSPDGKIEGRAFGTEVRGDWRWDEGLFCRDLAWGDRDLGPNCQLVKINGEKIRFIADAGQGDYADFSLE
jgi:hypothetical protein